jgi:DNA replication and repair protein RecF
MALRSLSVTALRCFEQLELEAAPGLNLVTGNNASGKTSLLEAIFLLGRGRSFRSAKRDALIREGSSALRVVSRLEDGRVLGMEVSGDHWVARAGGEQVSQLAELAALLPVQLLDPEVHRLVQEGPGERRRYLDWATFHVKPGFLEAWRTYQRALRQRNAALKARAPDSALEPWERTLSASGTELDRLRTEMVDELRVPVRTAARRLLEAELELGYRLGQAADESLGEALRASRERDRRAGMTQVGPHRADLVISVDEHKARGWVSRGQQKLVAASMVLGQAALLGQRWGGRGVLLVDDPAAELDRERCERLLALVAELPFQVFLTALEAGSLPGLTAERTFHVEQGRLRPVV